MPCFHPLKGYRKVDGGWTADFSKSIGSGAPFSVPCGQCVGCRLERSRQWAVRCIHEAKLYDRNVFITLTYDDKHLPVDQSLDYRHFQRFMKRLRKHFSGQTIRFYMAGEYGEQLGRPHYHAILFNCDFDDKTLWSVRNGNRCFRSKTLESLWPFGYSEIGSVTFQSAGYVARYVMKKVTGHHQDDHYYHEPTGSFRTPEFNRMSLKPGIGYDFFQKFMDDFYPHDVCIVNGSKTKPPRYYDRCYEELFPEDMAAIKKARVDYAIEHLDDATPERLYAKEQCTIAKVGRLIRPLT